jgi:hypothetical protein
VEKNKVKEERGTNEKEGERRRNERIRGKVKEKIETCEGRGVSDK